MLTRTDRPCRGPPQKRNHFAFAPRLRLGGFVVSPIQRPESKTLRAFFA